MIGTTLGHYRILKNLGERAMAIICKASAVTESTNDV
jgi:hypothetical protein